MREDYPTRFQVNQRTSQGSQRELSGNVGWSSECSRCVERSPDTEATYSGDANNPGVAGTCGDPAETVEVAINPNVELPSTGSETGILLQTGSGLLVAGSAMLGLGQRRRRTQFA